VSVALPPDGSTSIGGVLVPPGRALRAARAGAAARLSPVLWATNGPFVEAPDAWIAFYAQATESGLVPIMLRNLRSDPRRPWDNGEFGLGDVSEVGTYDVGALLGRMWAEAVASPAAPAELLDPFSTDFPGLAPPIEPPPVSDDDRFVNVLRSIPAARLGVVVADRPADIPAVLGWIGAVGYRWTPIERSAILRSWEARFGATLLELGFDEMSIVLEDPPLSMDEALPIAAEHFAFCPEAVRRRAGTLRQWAENLVGHPFWTFSWGSRHTAVEETRHR
jgi:hypothetical protein